MSNFKARYQNKHRVEIFDKKHYATKFDKIRLNRKARMINELIKALDAETLLDIGSGTGEMDRIIRIRSGTALDSSSYMLLKARKKLGGNWRFVNKDIFRYMPGGKFDIVIASRFLWHLDSAERKLLFSKVKLLLADGGVMVFDALTSDPTSKQSTWIKADLVKELKRNNYSIIKITPIMRFNRIQKRFQHQILMGFLELLPFGPSQEWLVFCRPRRS